MPIPQLSRRWQRLPVDLPVQVVLSTGPAIVVPGRSTELSEGGMLLYAGLLAKPGDLLEVEFETPQRCRSMAIVRSRSGYSFGLEFISPLPA